MNSRSFSFLAVFALVAGPLAAADHPLQCDYDQSTVEVIVKATIDSFTGHLKAYELTGTVDDTGHITAAQLAFHFRDVATGKPKRDTAMHEWQHTDTFPDAQFALTALTPDAGAFRASGRFTLHGVTREISFPVTIGQHGPIYAIDGDAPIDTRDFGLPIIRVMLALKVDPLVHVHFHFQAKAA